MLGLFCKCLMSVIGLMVDLLGLRFKFVGVVFVGLCIFDYDNFIYFLYIFM